MGRPRTPSAILELRGSYRKNPQRRRHPEPQPSGPLGKPPRLLAREERRAWRDIERITPPGVLTVADRWLVEIAARLMAKMRGPKGLRPGERTQLIQCLSKMGLTPADRSKVGVTPRPAGVNVFEELARERPN